MTISSRYQTIRKPTIMISLVVSGCPSEPLNPNSAIQIGLNRLILQANESPVW